MLDQMTNVIDDNPAIKDNNSSWIEVTKTSQPRISIKEPIWPVRKLGGTVPDMNYDASLAKFDNDELLQHELEC